MKATIAKLLPVLLLATSCSTGVFLTSGNADDVYYNSADKQVVVRKRIDAAAVPAVPARRDADQLALDSIRVAQRDYALVDSTRQEYVDENGNPVGDQNYYNGPEDDYYFSNRINRFYRPSMGFGFYDPWYSGMGMGFGGMGYGMGYGGMGYGGFGYYDPFYYDFYSPFGFYGNSWYNPWYGGYYGYGYGYNSWYGGGIWGDWDNNNYANDKNYKYGPRHSMRTDGISGDRSAGMMKSERVSARGGATASGTGSSSPATKSVAVNPAATQRSSADPKAVSTPSGYRTSISRTPNTQAGTPANQPARSNSSSYIRSRTGTSYLQPPVQGSSSLRSSGNTGSENRSSSYIRPKTSSSAGSSSAAGSYRPSGTSSSGRSSSSISSGSSYRPSGISSGSSSSSYRSSSSGSSSSMGSSSGRSSSSGSSSSGSGSSRSGGGGGGGRR